MVTAAIPPSIPAPAAANPAATAVEDGRRIDLVAPSVLLGERSEGVGRLYALSGCSDRQFDAAYTPLLTALAGYLQRVPCAAPPDGALLDRRLARAERVLGRRRAVILPPGAGSERAAREGELWTYLLFSLALVRQLARDLDRWSIALWTADGRSLGRWQPHLAPRGLLGAPKAASYSLQRAREIPGPDWTALVAGALMPAVGLNWLWREPSAIGVWQHGLSAPTLPPEIGGLLEDSPPNHEGN